MSRPTFQTGAAVTSYDVVIYEVFGFNKFVKIVRSCYLCQGGYDFMFSSLSVCLFVCLFVCQQLCAKTSKRICMKCSENIGNGPMNKRLSLNFGGDPDHGSGQDTDPDPYRETGKACFARSMHGPSASYSFFINYNMFKNHHFVKKQVRLDCMLLLFFVKMNVYFRFATHRILHVIDRVGTLYIG